MDVEVGIVIYASIKSSNLLDMFLFFFCSKNNSFAVCLNKLLNVLNRQYQCAPEGTMIPFV